MAAPSGLKIIVIGAEKTGKTSLVNQYIYKKFSSEYVPSTGLTVHEKHYIGNNGPIQVQIVDLPGNEVALRDASKSFEGADCCMLVYDVADDTSFEALEELRDFFLEESCVENPSDFMVVVVGNKSDLEERAVPPADIQAWCTENRAHSHHLVSAKTSVSVVNAFTAACECALTRRPDLGGPTREGSRRGSARKRSSASRSEFREADEEHAAA